MSRQPFAPNTPVRVTSGDSFDGRTGTVATDAGARFRSGTVPVVFEGEDGRFGFNADELEPVHIIELGELGDVTAERAANRVRWGVQDHPDGTAQAQYGHLRDRYREDTDQAAREGRVTWRHILLEEVFEALAEVDPEALREELVQVSAVALDWIEAIDRRLDAEGGE